MKWTIKRNGWTKGKKNVYCEGCEEWRGKERIWRVGEEHPERGLIRINPRSYSSLIADILHHSRTSFAIFVTLGISFLLCASRWKQRGNYANNERLIKSCFRCDDVVVEKRNSFSEICQVIRSRVLEMLVKRIRTLLARKDKFLFNDHPYFYFIILIFMIFLQKCNLNAISYTVLFLMFTIYIYSFTDKGTFKIRFNNNLIFFQWKTTKRRILSGS